MNRIVLSTVGVLAMACSGGELGRAPATAQSTRCDGGLVMSDLDLQRFEGCREVSGDLALRGVTSLAPLASLRRVDGALRIEHTTRLYTLAGLEQLRRVSSLEIHHNAGLINGGPLRHLEQADYVAITRNPRLSTTFGFLDGIRHAGGDVDLVQNWGLAAEGVPQLATPSSLAIR
jgi:hypothetical protein